MGGNHVEWQRYTFFCSYCGNRLLGYKNAKGLIKIECERCHSVSIRKHIGRRHNQIDVYAPLDLLKK
jgi:hypothetical protein